MMIGEGHGPGPPLGSATVRRSTFLCDADDQTVYTGQSCRLVLLTSACNGESIETDP